jgi:predicted phage terminase large subunit-like protein
MWSGSNPALRREGVIVAGKNRNGDAYVLADLSGRYQPIEWARIAVSAYRTHGADRIVAEVNQGGDLVEQTIRTVDQNVAFTAVWASRGKVTRAEPVSALYEQARVHHLGAFPALEDQMCAFTADVDRAAGSPDRVDALVWAITELMIAPQRSFGMFELYRQMAEEQTARVGVHRRTRPGAAAARSHPEGTAALRRPDGGPAADAGRGRRARRGDRCNLCGRHAYA